MYRRFFDRSLGRSHRSAHLLNLSFHLSSLVLFLKSTMHLAFLIAISLRRTARVSQNPRGLGFLHEAHIFGHSHSRKVLLENLRSKLGAGSFIKCAIHALEMEREIRRLTWHVASTKRPSHLLTRIPYVAVQAMVARAPLSHNEPLHIPPLAPISLTFGPWTKYLHKGGF